MVGPGMVWGWSSQGGLETPEGTVIPAPAGRVAVVVCRLGAGDGAVRNRELEGTRGGAGQVGRWLERAGTGLALSPCPGGPEPGPSPCAEQRPRAPRPLRGHVAPLWLHHNVLLT